MRTCNLALAVATEYSAIAFENPGAVRFAYRMRGRRRRSEETNERVLRHPEPAAGEKCA
ncbi:MAG: hypothetical protein IPJ98_15405 [Bryobacterales bacterium]|nr:hypothetical protein [Bryobacterales bacterium]